MFVGELLLQLDCLGVELRTPGPGRLQFRDTRGELTPELKAEIKANREAVIRILEDNEVFQRTNIIQNQLQVFELAREHFRLRGKGEA